MSRRMPTAAPQHLARRAAAAFFVAVAALLFSAFVVLLPVMLIWTAKA